MTLAVQWTKNPTLILTVWVAMLWACPSMTLAVEYNLKPLDLP